MVYFATMLVIRKEQFEAFQLDSDIRWYDGRLAELYPPFAMASGKQRYEWVRGGVERALSFGLGRPDFFQFLCFEQTFFPGCLDDPAFGWARVILAEYEKTSAARVKKLRHTSVGRLLEIEAQEEHQAAELLAAQEEAELEADAEDDLTVSEEVYS